MRPTVSILVLDDEPDVLDSISSMLHHAADGSGYTIVIHTALTATDALVICQREHLDASFIDYYLRGGLNGEEFLSRLDGRSSEMLMIMMSARPEDELQSIVTKRHQAMGLRFRYLRKPISNLTIKSCFLNVVDFIRQRRPDTILIAAPKPLEWEACRDRLHEPYEVVSGFLVRGRIGEANVVVAQTGKGQATTAAALAPLLAQWQPHYVFLVGIAGGVAAAKKGDVVVASFVYSFDFGKIENGAFRLRPESNWSPAKKLLDVATMLAEESSQTWKTRIRRERPNPRGPKTRAHIGYAGSSEKLIDDLAYPVIVDALRAAPEVLAVEMEAIGAQAAVREMHANGQLRSHAGLIMIRGISDEPVKSKRKLGAGKNSRTQWTVYAADAAAAFAEAVVLNVYPSRIQPLEIIAVVDTGNM